MVSPYTDESLYGRRPPRFVRVEHTIVWASGESSMRAAVLDRATGLVSRFVTAELADRALGSLLRHGDTGRYVWRPIADADVLNEDKEVK